MGKIKTRQKAEIRYFYLLTVLKDLVAFISAYTIAIAMEFNIDYFGKHNMFGWIAVLLTVLSLFLTNGYRIVWRYAGLQDVIRVVFAHVMVFFALITLNAIVDFGATVSLITIYSYFALSFSVLLRFYQLIFFTMIRIFADKSKIPPKNTIIYGAGFTGASLVKRFMNNADEGYNPVCILDDDATKHKKIIAGLRVVGGRESIHDALKRYRATTVVIAITDINREELRQIYFECVRSNANVKIATNISDATNTFNVDAISLKNINITDLLHRPEHKINQELLDNLICGNVIMVTGGAGSIGSEICRQALQYGCKHLVIFDHFENGMFDINEEFSRRFPKDRYSLVVGTVKDREKLRIVMNTYKPDVVFHAAAYKHVPMMEINCDEAVKNNIFGTKNVIDQCAENGIKKFILISTDKAVNPANIMGASKRMAELLVESKASEESNTVFAAVRFGNVLGSSGSVIPTFIKQISNGGPVTVTHKDMKRYFMTIPEAVRLVMQAGSLAKSGDVFVLDMGDPVYIYDLACDLIRLSGMEPMKDIKIEVTGLRPGEKLFEELRFNTEDVNKTTHDGIFICKLEPVDNELLESTLVDLQLAVKNMDNKAAEKAIFTMVPDKYRNI
ncbi:MAG: polysaccharide biosynthesis protein [Christensenellaceae bacterium]|jgi:FlaA1/EpsC-like NDP-sugar epimerase|nr:polysaccharide biosynthesis protein [Christensenellaceae bacterium]